MFGIVNFIFTKPKHCFLISEVSTTYKKIIPINTQSENISAIEEKAARNVHYAINFDEKEKLG